MLHPNSISFSPEYPISGLSIEWENGADICPDELYNNSKKILEG